MRAISDAPAATLVVASQSVTSHPVTSPSTQHQQPSRRLLVLGRALYLLLGYGRIDQFVKTITTDCLAAGGRHSAVSLVDLIAIATFSQHHQVTVFVYQYLHYLVVTITFIRNDMTKTATKCLYTGYKIQRRASFY